MQQSLAQLKLSVDTLANETARVRQDIHRRTLALWVAVAVGAVVIVMLGVSAFTVGLDNRRALAENNRRWCPMVAVLLPQPGEPAPATERGRVVVENAKQLFKDFGCADAKP